MSREVAAVRSMTGFGSSSSDAGGTMCTVTLKSVNHRFLDVQMRLPGGYELLEAELRRSLKAEIARGHVEVTVEMGRADGAQGLHVNEGLFASLVEELRGLAARCELSTEINAVSLLRVQGMLVQKSRSQELLSLEVQARVPVVVAAALAQFQQARELEGAELAKAMRGSMLRLRVMLGEIRRLRAGVRQTQFVRLRERLRELLADTAVSDDRLLTEAALLAEKSDVEEEAVRLQTHIDRFVGLLDEGGAVGKQLDFLLQEFHREANTILSKSGSAAGPESTHLIGLGLEMKAEIERVREQVQNLE